MAVTRPAVFIDKDGTLIHDVPYNVDPARIALVPGAGEALRLMQEAGYAIVIATNQPGVAAGRFPASALDGVRGRLEALLAPHGVKLTGFYYCPHAPASASRSCGCRKPEPGLLHQAATRHAIDLAASWMIGDILNDVEAGRRAGCRTALIDCGNETQWELSAWRMPDLVAHDLRTAAQLVTRVACTEAARAEAVR